VNAPAGLSTIVIEFNGRKTSVPSTATLVQLGQLGIQLQASTANVQNLTVSATDRLGQQGSRFASFVTR
jgi:hypothetical protein